MITGNHNNLILQALDIAPRATEIHIPLMRKGHRVALMVDATVYHEQTILDMMSKFGL